MKKILGIFFLIVCIGNLWSQEIEIKPGTVLIYDAISGGNTYQLTVKMIQTEPAVELDYSFSESAGKSGKVVMMKDAVEFGERLMTTFVNSSSVYNDRTILLLSKSFITKLMKDEKIQIFFDNESTVQSMKKVTTSKYKINFKGKETELDAYEVSNEMPAFKAKSFKVFANEKFPLLLEFGIQWKFKLIEAR